MDLGLRGKVAIVTGASQGIGQAIARELSSEGMNLVLTARSSEHLRALSEELATDSLVLPLDLTRVSAPQKLVNACIERFGQLDVLVNNAGNTKRGDFLELTEADWAEGFALKFYGAVRCCRAAWPHLRRSAGSVVNVVGIGGRTGNAEFTIGGAVNAALLNLTKALAHRGVADGIRVNAVNPASIASDRLQGRIAGLSKERGIAPTSAAAELAASLGVTRFGKPSEVARVVSFLASPAAAYCIGTIVDVDGGQTRTL